jgi:predicted methyltransferase
LADADDIVREVAAAVGLAEGEQGVRTVLAALARLEPVSTRRISRAAELPVPIVAAVCGELRKRSVVAEQRPGQLTPAGRQLFADGSLKLGGAGCPSCSGRGIVVTHELAPLVRELSKVVRGGPPARLELDQCHCTVDTKLRRVLAIHEAGALVGRRVLLLGDDDLTALALSLLVQRHGSPSTIASLTVVDVDPALVSFLERELADAPFAATCIEHDLRRPLPPKLVGAFDTVVTDPPYTTQAARLFLSRAADALDGRRGDVFLSFGSRRPGAGMQVQRAIVEIGFVIQRLSRDFNEYVGAGVLGGTSHLYHLAGTDDVEPVVTGTLAAPLYTSAQTWPSNVSRR